jgi:hypothetical protein
MLQIKKIPSLLPSSLVSGVHEVGGGTCIITPLYYPNGDSINIYFRKTDEGILATDEGATTDNLAQRGIKLTKERREIVEMICRARGASFLKPDITRMVKERSLSADFFSFCQAISDVSSLHYHAMHHKHSTQFHEKVDSLVRKKIEVSRKVEREWTDPAIDPKGSFPVDYHLNGGGPPRNVFCVTSGGKALLVTAIAHFLRSHDIDIPTLAVVDSSANVKGRQLDRLQFASTKLIFGIKGHEKQIVNFALGKAA